MPKEETDKKVSRTDKENILCRPFERYMPKCKLKLNENFKECLYFYLNGKTWVKPGGLLCLPPKTGLVSINVYTSTGSKISSWERENLNNCI